MLGALTYHLPLASGEGDRTFLRRVPAPSCMTLMYTYRRVLQSGCHDGAAVLTPIVQAPISPLDRTGQPASGATARATTRALPLLPRDRQHPSSSSNAG
jgi:hypothetical protein